MLCSLVATHPCFQIARMSLRTWQNSGTTDGLGEDGEGKVLQRQSLTSHRQADAQPFSKTEPPWKLNPTPPLQFLLLNMRLHGTGYPFGQLSQPAIPAVSPSRFLSTPSLLAEGGMWRGESLDTVQALFSSSQSTAVLSTLF